MAYPWGSHRTDSGLRASGGATRRQRWREAGAGGRAGIFEERALEGIFEERALEGTFEEQALKDLKPPQGWIREPRTKEGWTDQRDDGERRGGTSISRSVSRSIRSPTKSSSPRCKISSPSATVQGAELNSALTPSTAGSLVVGTVAGSRTWSDVLGSTSGAILCSVARLCDGSLIAAVNGSPSSVGSG